jgi:hypothetical protein
VQLNMTTLDKVVQTEDEKMAASNTGENLQQQALNGAQVTSLIEIVKNLAAGLLTPSGAKAVILSAFPTMSPQSVDQIISGTVSGAVAADAQPMPQDSPGEPMDGTPEDDAEDSTTAQEDSTDGN